MEKAIQKYLLSLARKTIADELGIKHEMAVARPDDSEILNEKRGVFVTLTMDMELRGCIGYILPMLALENAVRKNALNAGFGDPRFYPIQKEDFENIRIEISVLTVPKKLEYEGVDDLLSKLRPNIDGVILRKGENEATYLPQVWENLPEKDEFLGTLCAKAGMHHAEWRKGELEVLTYQAEVFQE
jgi:AmmeMemoRadiSam system protein A